jgi:hypothetical protein
MMVESHVTWDLVPNVDQKAYGEWSKKAIGTLLKTPGLIEVRANRNLCGSPQVLIVDVWENMAAFGNFSETVWPALEAELNPLVQNVHYTLWATSPVLPQPLRPAK